MIKLGVTTDMHTIPLHYVLQNNIMPHDLNLIAGDEVQIADYLKKGEVDLAQINPVEYAKNPGEYVLVPEVCVSYEKKIPDMLLFFNKNKTDFKKIAVNTANPFAIILAKVLVYDKYEMEPVFEYKSGDTETLLKQYDAVLATGIPALQEKQRLQQYFDLGEEWIDFIGLPLVLTFWAGKKENVNKQICRLLKKARNAGVPYIPEIIKNEDKKNIVQLEYLQAIFINNYSYNFSEEYHEGLKKLWEYAFYYSEIEHIPNLSFWDSDM